jgi:hypothetical protein
MDGVRALALAPGDATVLRLSGGFLVSMGRQFDEGISAARRAVALCESKPDHWAAPVVPGSGVRSGIGVARDRSAHGSSAQRAPLPGNRAATKVSELRGGSHRERACKAAGFHRKNIRK